MLNRARPFLDMKRIVSLLRSADWTNPGLIKEFEDTFARIVDAPKAFATDRGRSALLLALKSLDIGSKDEVIVQSLICRVVIDAILEIGAIPVLVDNSLEDYQASATEIRKKITDETKAIIVAHLYGIPCQIDEISIIARENNCYLIEDCAHSLGAQYDDRNVGTYGDLAFFSFNFDKPVSAGNGGMLIVNNLGLLDKVNFVLEGYKRKSLQSEKEMVYGFILQHLLTQRDHYCQFLSITFGEALIKSELSLRSIFDGLLEEGRSEAEITEEIFCFIEDNRLLTRSSSSTTFRRLYSKAKSLSGILSPTRLFKIEQIEQTDLLMNSLRAVVGLEQLKHLNFANHIRNENAQFLADHLDSSLYSLPTIDAKSTPTFLRYTVLNRTGLPSSEIAKAAMNAGFEISNYNWSKPVHLTYPYHKILSYDRDTLRNSEELTQHLLNIPIHPYVEKKNLESMITVLNAFGG